MTINIFSHNPASMQIEIFADRNIFMILIIDL